MQLLLFNIKYWLLRNTHFTRLNGTPKLVRIVVSCVAFVVPHCRAACRPADAPSQIASVTYAARHRGAMVCRFVCIEMCRQKISRHMILGRDVRVILSRLLLMFLGTVVSSTRTPI